MGSAPSRQVSGITIPGTISGGMRRASRCKGFFVEQGGGGLRPHVRQVGLEFVIYLRV